MDSPDVSLPAFAAAAVPPITLRPGAVDDLPGLAARLAPGGRVLLVADRFLALSGRAGRIAAALEAAGHAVTLEAGIAGEPGIGDIRRAHAHAQGAGLVVGIGGGSALDVAKSAAALAHGADDPLSYACAARPLPPSGAPRVLIPTTAGTGAESSSTAVFAGPDGRKLWIWGPETKASHILLDPELTLSLPPALTAWCAMDAFVHAFEAATNRHAHPGAQLYAHAAMAMIARALPRAVDEGTDLAARTELLLAACYAGTAIDNCGCAVAHNISHAMAGLAEVPHGLATALAFEATLPWLVEAGTPALAAAAAALGLSGPAALPAAVTGLMDRAGIARRLPPALAEAGAEALAAAMRAPENAPMRLATARELDDDAIDRFAAAMVALAAPVRQDA
ncbi:hypothetical protein LNKW23_10580 [Paralimibaculum aggregatum]|uniref:Alcohol dehydrogenase n=1 Tax=Paralimibaculum aggregatum TaxID=3036245 RepID=A0ABQ6LI03_9RHOB|nr:iron-containing alcohol dehydrogenase [Limibaculum sp. NKW23]GMG81845.1 hypothetical protein LNKW23_10580 [Limibaculum sp. NKW23]